MGASSGTAKARRDPGGVRGYQRRRPPKCGEDATLGISERERFGESEGGGSHTSSGDLGVPPWSGEPGVSQKLEAGEYCVVSYSGLCCGRRATGRCKAGAQAATLGLGRWGVRTRARNGRLGSSEALPPRRSRQRSREEAVGRLGWLQLLLGACGASVANSYNWGPV